MSLNARTLEVLCREPIRHLKTEQQIVAVRRDFLMAAISGSSGSVAEAAAVAVQMGLKEYPISPSSEEAVALPVLRSRCASAVGHDLAFSLSVLASYEPIAQHPATQRILKSTGPDELVTLLRMQVSEPQEEAALEPDIPRLTPIRNEISRIVERHYASAPYPRWASFPEGGQKVRPFQVMNFVSPEAKLQEQAWEAAPEVLVAGCGTGRHAFYVAQLFEGVKVLAIDLSRSSLAYAVRKYRESSLTNVEFAQADILELPATGLRFDVIECGGVLHHLADPWAGLRALTVILRAGGFIRIVLYSAIVRRKIDAVRRWASQQGFTSEPESVKRFRATVIEQADNPLFEYMINVDDFYTLSELRDLAFHPQERPVTIPEIKDVLRRTGLRFLGFYLKPAVEEGFLRRHTDLSDLDSWARFEEEHPDTFTNMYDFWVQKPPD